MQQIDMAVEMFDRKQWTCSITLALAAESQMPMPEKPFVTGTLAARNGGKFIDQLNEVRNWLKHTKDPEKSLVYELDAVSALLRAISKFTACYGAWSEPMSNFDALIKERMRSIGAFPSSNWDANRLRGPYRLSGIIEKIATAECSLNGEPAT